jgi:hypothetical protein
MRIDSFCGRPLQTVPATIFGLARRGGDIIPVSENPIRTLVCLCGNPILPRRLRSGDLRDYQSFQKSFESARQYRERTNPEAILRKIAEPCASKSQHDELAERIAKMETILKELPPSSSQQPSKP